MPEQPGLAALRVDLHAHSTRSDGTLAPAALFERAAGTGVGLFALTDHDALPAIDQPTCVDAMQILSGIELTTLWQGRVIHVLGLRFEPDEAGPLARGVAAQHEARLQRAARIAARLQKRGIEGALEGAMIFAGDGAVGRPHFARWLVQAGHARDLEAAFRLFLSDKLIGTAATVWAPLEDAVRWIVGQGGTAVLAHPAKYRFTHTRLRDLVADFKSAGGAALEVISGPQVPATTRQLADVCRRFELAASAGSDFHGGPEDRARLGHTSFLPDDLVPVWRDWC